MTGPESQPSDVLLKSRFLAISALVMFIGAAGIALSGIIAFRFRFLDDQQLLAIVIVVSIVVGIGLLSLFVQHFFPSTRPAAIHVVESLGIILPPFITALAMPIAYFGMFQGALIIIPVVKIVCPTWAWFQSKHVSFHISALLGWRRDRLLRIMVFATQLIAILSMWPLFLMFLDLLVSLGVKSGWS